MKNNEIINTIASEGAVVMTADAVAPFSSAKQHEYVTKISHNLCKLIAENTGKCRRLFP